MADPDEREDVITAGVALAGALLFIGLACLLIWALIALTIGNAA